MSLPSLLGGLAIVALIAIAAIVSVIRQRRPVQRTRPGGPWGEDLRERIDAWQKREDAKRRRAREARRQRTRQDAAVRREEGW